MQNGKLKLTRRVADGLFPDLSRQSGGPRSREWLV